MNSYKLVIAHSDKALTEQVSALMADGWKPQGAPQWYEKDMAWVQAMTHAGKEQNGQIPLRERKA